MYLREDVSLIRGKLLQRSQRTSEPVTNDIAIDPGHSAQILPYADSPSTKSGSPGRWVVDFDIPE